MTKVQKVLIAGAVIASLIAANVKAQTLGTGSSGVDHELKTPVLALRLDSMDGLEIQSIREEGLEPVKTSTGIVFYQGRRALRVIDDAGVTADGKGAGAQVLAIVKNSDFKVARSKSMSQACHARVLLSARPGLSGLRSASRAQPTVSKRSIFGRAIRGPTINSGATIQPSTSGGRTFLGNVCARRVPEYTNPTSILIRPCGPRPRSW